MSTMEQVAGSELRAASLRAIDWVQEKVAGW
jgi:hypothetical protein